MMAHGLPLGVLHQVVRDGLARENREVKVGAARPITVIMLQITAAGRLGLASK
jgi:hypothetical protein